MSSDDDTDVEILSNIDEETVLSDDNVDELLDFIATNKKFISKGLLLRALKSKHYEDSVDDVNNSFTDLEDSATNVAGGAAASFRCRDAKETFDTNVKILNPALTNQQLNTLRSNTGCRVAWSELLQHVMASVRDIFVTFTAAHPVTDDDSLARQFLLLDQNIQNLVEQQA
jgi:hypothetical protein